MERIDGEILLVEDDSSHAEIIQHCLRGRCGSESVVWVNTGEAALAYVRDARVYPRLVLLDVGLPRLDGLEVLGRLKSAYESRAIPIVLLTSSTLPSDVACAYERGANGYVVKPTSLAEFQGMITDLVSFWLRRNMSAPRYAGPALPAQSLG